MHEVLSINAVVFIVYTKESATAGMLSRLVPIDHHIALCGTVWSSNHPAIGNMHN